MRRRRSNRGSRRNRPPACRAKPPQARLALVIDQMEELFTDTRLDAPAREAFLAALDALARGGRTWILATLRSDFFAQCEANPTLIALKAGDGTYHLLPPSRGGDQPHDLPSGQRRRIAIRARSAHAGIPGRRAARRRRARSGRAAAAGVHARRALQARGRRPTGRPSRRADYDALGGLEGALATRAEAVFAEIQARDARAAEALPAVFGALARLAPASRQRPGGRGGGRQPERAAGTLRRPPRRNWCAR